MESCRALGLAAVLVLAGCGGDRTAELERELDRQITAFMNQPGDAATTVEVDCDRDACTSRAVRRAAGAEIVVEGDIRVSWKGECFSARTVRVRSEHLDVPADPRNVMRGCL